MEDIKLLIVDDSAVVRQVLSGMFDKAHGFHVMAAVADPIFAMKRMETEWPDVIILDIEMPRMDGISFLKKIMAERPTPVVICSTLTTAGAETTMQAVAAGAVDIVAKPKLALKASLSEEAAQLIDAVRAASKARIDRLVSNDATTTKKDMVPVKDKLTADAVLAPVSNAMSETTQKIISIGTSTGGTQALEFVLTRLTRISPGIVIVQHMPEKFTAAFSQRLDSICEIKVKEAENGDRIVPGHAFIAPGGKHMLVKRSGAQYRIEVVDGPLVCRHRPSVDVLFRSVAKSAGKNAIGIIMTGMGDDGANGLKEMRDVGAYTIAQDENSCVVYGMPKEAVKRGAVVKSLALNDIPGAIMQYA